MRLTAAYNWPDSFTARRKTQQMIAAAMESAAKIFDIFFSATRPRRIYKGDGRGVRPEKAPAAGTILRELPKFASGVRSERMSMSAHQQSDEWLMDCVCRGDTNKMEILVRRYSTPIMTFLRRMVLDVHRSEELFQEVFLAVWKHRSRYIGSRPFRPWLYQIAL